MDYKLLNDIEAVIEACCVGNGPGDVRLDYESSPAAGTLAYEIGKLLNGIHLTDKDWTLIGINIQSGLAMAATKAMRILGASCDMAIITHDGKEEL